MKLSFMNKVSRIAVLEVLIDNARRTIDSLAAVEDQWDQSSGSVAQQVAFHFRRERIRQDERLLKMREELRVLLEKVPRGVLCGVRGESGWDCNKHVGHIGPHNFAVKGRAS